MSMILSRGLVFFTLIATSAAAAFAADAKPATKVLIDFTRQDVEVAGAIEKPIKKYDYTYDAWLNKLVFLEGRGLLIPALPGNGGMGKEAHLAIGATATHCVIEFVIGNRNESDSFNLSMVDRDGTEAVWTISLKGRPRGVGITVPLDLAKPDTEAKPGKKPGFDKTKTGSWQIRGNWQEPKLELLLVRLSKTTP